MKNFINDNWSIFNESINNKPIYLFGYNGAINILKNLKKYDSCWKVKGILDNDSRKHGTINICEDCYEICSPDVLRNEEKGSFIVLICSTYTKEIGEQLEEMGIDQYYSEIWMDRAPELKSSIVPQTIDYARLEKVKKLLKDEKSRNLMDTIAGKREIGEIDYSDIMERGQSEYFRDEFWSPFKDGVFVDAGGYDGDTIEEIVRWTKGNFKRIYSFEPQKNLAEKIANDVAIKYSDKIRLFNSGLWSSTGKQSFSEGTDVLSGTISESGVQTINVVSLDEVVDEPVSFIKMDIEGAELEALKGAKAIIQSSRPYMAICIYHKPNDLWEIPLLLNEYLADYDFYVRHCGISCYGTILYAVPRK